MSKITITVKTDNNGKNNEDSSFTAEQGERCLLCVADGVGGTDAGEIASAYVTKNMEVWSNENDINAMGSKTLHRSISEFALRMHDDLIAIGEERGISLGTTLALAVVGINNVVIENIGDSRVYVCQRGYLKQVTYDQTVRMYELVNGEILDYVPEKKKDSTLLQCIGDGPKDPVPAQYALAIDEDVDILICSDGLSNKLNELNIQSQLVKKQSAEEALDNLIALAKKRNEKDNITAILYRRRKGNTNYERRKRK